VGAEPERTSEIVGRPHCMGGCVVMGCLLVYECEGESVCACVYVRLWVCAYAYLPVSVGDSLYVRVYGTHVCACGNTFEYMCNHNKL
jgi:hypothetical protein